MPYQVTERAWAKVNLCLHVTGQRDDGFHLLDSIVAFAGIGDRLDAAQADAPSLTLEGPFGAEIPASADNLVLRAAQAYAPDFPASFTLSKTLPPASGIGGGSADAAAAVRALARLRGKAQPDPRDPAIRGLGADVPVCLLSRPARMRGIGEHVEPLPALPGGGILLVNPRVEVPTPAVFKALTQKDNPPLPATLPDWRDMAALAQWLHDTRNDLEPPALTIAPAIAEVLAALRGLPGTLFTRMSGSGATCFALFADRATAEGAAPAMRAAHPHWWVAAGPLFGGRDDTSRPDQEIRATT